MRGRQLHSCRARLLAYPPGPLPAPTLHVARRSRPQVGAKGVRSSFFFSVGCDCLHGPRSFFADRGAENYKKKSNPWATKILGRPWIGHKCAAPCRVRARGGGPTSRSGPAQPQPARSSPSRAFSNGPRGRGAGSGADGGRRCRGGGAEGLTGRSSCQRAPQTGAQTGARLLLMLPKMLLNYREALERGTGPYRPAGSGRRGVLEDHPAVQEQIFKILQDIRGAGVPLARGIVRGVLERTLPGLACAAFTWVRDFVYDKLKWVTRCTPARMRACPHQCPAFIGVPCLQMHAACSLHDGGSWNRRHLVGVI
jgi:hypothetical protein